MTTFYLVRHGEPDWDMNEIYKFKGHGRDLVALTNKGKEQAKVAANLLQTKKAQIIITSPYTRTMQTAAILSRELGIDMEVEVDLREWQPDLTFEYKSYDEFMILCDEYDKNQGIALEDEKQKWETQKALQDRVDFVLNKYLEYDRVIVVAHEKVIKTQATNILIEHCEVIEIKK